ncbi:hypothetical protein [Streptomyces sp. NBC_01264]|uniref:hypothetical protein n=1 Tax=Streptomyces sp. NBC_01264 TaxID=2903804 RepID=UPI0022587115|nr:hypothetical protein [Streptomyces sp. NBC_01264]MCX4776814.1 hypothetical protein [Streptomyces sp. NBC_01264]
MSSSASNRPPKSANHPAVAAAWAEVLVRRGHLHAALPAPTGQWLVQEGPESPVLVLPGPEDLLDLAAQAQRLDHASRGVSR